MHGRDRSRSRDGGPRKSNGGGANHSYSPPTDSPARRGARNGDYYNGGPSANGSGGGGGGSGRYDPPRLAGSGLKRGRGEDHKMVEDDRRRDSYGGGGGRYGGGGGGGVGGGGSWGGRPPLLQRRYRSRSLDRSRRSGRDVGTSRGGDRRGSYSSSYRRRSDDSRGGGGRRGSSGGGGYRQRERGRSRSRSRDRDRRKDRSRERERERERERDGRRGSGGGGYGGGRRDLGRGGGGGGGWRSRSRSPHRPGRSPSPMGRPYHQQHQAPPLPPPPLPSMEERKAADHGGAGGRSGSKRSGGGSGDSYDSRDDTVGHYGGKAGDWIDGRYKVVKDVGLGTFGRVVECLDERQPGARGENGSGASSSGSSTAVVAIKMVRSIPKYVESAKIEADILRDVNRRGGRGTSLCVQLLRHFDFQGHCCLVFEKLGTSLYDFLKAHDYRPYPCFPHVHDFARQLLEALEFLHDTVGLIHTDLKPENILLVSNATSFMAPAPASAPGQPPHQQQEVPASTRVKVIDFGGATYDDDAHKSSIVNTRQYRAPEVILELGWSYPSDLWSAGCILAELYTGDLYFATHDNAEHLALMERGLGPFPREMLAQSRVAPRFFDVGAGQSRWREELDKESQRHVRKQPRIDEVFARHRDTGVVELVQGLLQIDPKRRLSARRALQSPFFSSASEEDGGAGGERRGRSM